MKRLTKKDLNVYLEEGALSQPFLQVDCLKEKVNLDFNAKIKNNPQHTKLESLFNWINHVIKFSNDKEFIKSNKFQRTAEEIWRSGFAVGCSDYALLFATFARQLGWATTVLATAEINWFNNLQKGTNRCHSGHYFCECFYDGKWLLVDPTNKKIEKNYSLEVINLSYQLNNSHQFVPYLRCLDLGKRQNIKQHNQEMDIMCSNL